MGASPDPPKTYHDFVAQYPDLGKAWDLIHTAGEAGPLEAKTARLVKLAVAIGAMREGAVHSSVRKALAQGISKAEIDQVVCLSASTLGLPATVAVFSWVRDHIEGTTAKARTRVRRIGTNLVASRPARHSGREK